MDTIQEIEKAVLGQCLLIPGSYQTTLDWFSGGEDFYVTEHKSIYTTLGKLYTNNIPIDLLTFFNEHKKISEHIGEDIYYLTNCTRMVCNNTNLENHCAIIVQESVRR